MTNIKFLSLLLLLFLIFFSTTVLAQTPGGGVTLYGKVQDAQTKTALAYLSLALKTEKDQAFVSGTLTDEAGTFTFTGLKKGAYLLEATLLGYQPTQQRVLIGELSPFLDLGLMLMVDDSKTLGEITVTTKADEVSGKMDKKTFAVANNLSQSRGSVLQAMSNLRGVSIGQDGKVQLRGSDKVAVLMDGKQTALTGYGSQTGLDNLPASALERIEIIQNPAAKYDANASAGIINLVFKKQEQEGFNGKIGITAGAGALWIKKENLPTIRPQFQGTPKINPSLSVNYRKKATNIFLQGDWLYARMRQANGQWTWASPIFCE